MRIISIDISGRGKGRERRVAQREVARRGEAEEKGER